MNGHFSVRTRAYSASSAHSGQRAFAFLSYATWFFRQYRAIISATTYCSFSRFLAAFAESGALAMAAYGLGRLLGFPKHVCAGARGPRGGQSTL